MREETVRVVRATRTVRHPFRTQGAHMRIVLLTMAIALPVVAQNATAPLVLSARQMRMRAVLFSPDTLLTSINHIFPVFVAM